MHRSFKGAQQKAFDAHKAKHEGLHTFLHHGHHNNLGSTCTLSTLMTTLDVRLLHTDYYRLKHLRKADAALALYAQALGQDVVEILNSSQANSLRWKQHLSGQTLTWLSSRAGYVCPSTDGHLQDFSAAVSRS